MGKNISIQMKRGELSIDMGVFGDDEAQTVDDSSENGDDDWSDDDEDLGVCPLEPGFLESQSQAGREQRPRTVRRYHWQKWPGKKKRKGRGI